MKQDEVIKKKVSEILFNNMENADQGINIEVENGFVKLSGIVDILSEKNYAEDMARTIEGVKGVDNSLSISMDGNIDDSDITRTVIDRILSHPGLKEAGLGAETKKGTVYLMGTVKALDDSNTARDIAGTVIGVKEIVNLIKIKEGSERPYDDVSLVNAVSSALFTAGEVPVHDITTSCVKGVIYLDGVADSMEGKQAATHYASTVPGVKKVINRVKVYPPNHPNHNK